MVLFLTHDLFHVSLTSVKAQEGAPSRYCHEERFVGCILTGWERCKMLGTPRERRVRKLTITRRVRLHDEYDYTTSTITRRVRLYDEYEYTTSSKDHDYVYGIDDGKGLADGVGR